MEWNWHGHFSELVTKSVFENIINNKTNLQSFVREGNVSERLQKLLPWMSKVVDQRGCGSCWAVVIANSLSDCFLIADLVQKPVQLSFDFLLRCDSKQEMCLGGNVGSAMQFVIDVGLIDSNEVNIADYSWCEENALCSEINGSKHFEHLSELERAKILNDTVPSCPQLHESTFLYSIDRSSSVEHQLTSTSKLEDHVKEMKKHLLTVGPFPFDIMIFENFLSGTVYQGIYFEKFVPDIINEKFLIDEVVGIDDWKDRPSNPVGSHSMVCVGFGQKRVVVRLNGSTEKTIEQNTTQAVLAFDVEYWVCQNSWGDKWSDNGYIRIASYGDDNTPNIFRNHLSCIEMYNEIVQSDERFHGGTSYFFRPGPILLSNTKGIREKLKYFQNKRNISNRPSVADSSISKQCVDNAPVSENAKAENLTLSNAVRVDVGNKNKKISRFIESMFINFTNTKRKLTNIASELVRLRNK